MYNILKYMNLLNQSLHRIRGGCIPLGWLLFASLVGCGPAFQNELYEADEAFRQALPRKEQLELAYEGSSSTQTTQHVDAQRSSRERVEGCPFASLGARRTPENASDPALSCTPNAYQNLTEQVVWSVNVTLDELLSLLDRMRSAPPSARTALSRQWGPYVVGEDANVYLMLEMVYDEPLYQYELWVGSSPDYLPDLAMKGHYLYLISPDEGSGAFWFDADVRQKYFPESTAGGLYGAEYTLTPELRQVVVEGNGLTDASHSIPTDQVVAYELSPSDGGRFYFDRPYDLNDNDGQVERISIWTLWDGSGQGRADGSYYFESPREPLQAGTECWDASYTTTYYQYYCGEGGDPSLCIEDAIGWNETP
ncbi:MAG: hypothetical protein ACKO6N_01485 [Myxococcota bacterium]